MAAKRNCDRDDLEDVALVFGAVVTALCIWMLVSDQCELQRTHAIEPDSGVVIETYGSLEDYYRVSQN